MNNVLFTCKYFTIRVREVVAIIVLLILLFFGFKACQKKEVEKKKEDKIVNICDFTSENINDFNKLLSRVDLCSDGWFKDLDAYIVRIEDQNKHLEKKTEKEYKAVLNYQVDLLNQIKEFKKNQKDINVDKLENSFKEYKNFYDGKCVKDKGK